MCAGGLMGRDRGHPVETCLAGLEIQHYMSRANVKRGRLRQAPWELRIGIHTGSVMSGVVGRNKFTYDIWGDTVNIAARMQSASEPGRINVSESTYQHVKDYFDLNPRGTLDVKNKGQMTMYFLEGLKPDFSRDGDAWRPNDKLKSAMAGATSAWSLPK